MNFQVEKILPVTLLKEYGLKSHIKGYHVYMNHCVKSIRIRSYSGPHFPAFGLNAERYVNLDNGLAYRFPAHLLLPGKQNTSVSVKTF